MSKINKAPVMEELHCFVCGCRYEYEVGDVIEYTHVVTVGGGNIVRDRKTPCPCCGYLNEAKFVNYNE